MKRALAISVLAAFCLTACQTLKPAPPAAALSTRNNSYSLLCQLLHEEKDVDLLHFIKREDPETKKLVQRIAATSKAGAKALEQYARSAPAIPIDATGLPPGEVRARDAISDTKEKELLGRKGPELDLTLLLAQAEALSYGWHLAEVAAANESQPDRVRALHDVRDQYHELHQELFALLLSRMK